MLRINFDSLSLQKDEKWFGAKPPLPSAALLLLRGAAR